MAVSITDTPTTRFTNTFQAMEVGKYSDCKKVLSNAARLHTLVELLVHLCWCQAAYTGLSILQS